MKKIILLLTSFIILQNINAQCWQTVSGGSGHSLSIRTDGTLWGWGWNAFGQVGDGSFTNRIIPTQIGLDSNWHSISAGDFHSLAIRTDGTLWAWGRNMYGELGDGGSTDLNIPVQIGTDNDWKAISAGGWHSLALKTDGTLWAWGSNYENGNYYGQVGDGSITNKHVPTQIGTANDWKFITAGYIFSFAIKNNGTRWAWGCNLGAYLGNGITSPYINIPTLITSASDWLKGNCGYAHCLAIKTDSTLWAWGNNYAGQIGNGTNYTAFSPTQIGTVTNWKMASGSAYHTVALKSDGTLWVWGTNDYGELGDGTYDPSPVPIQVTTAGNEWKEVEAGNVHNLAIKNDGSLWAWGYNIFGQVGDSTTIDKHVPTQIICRRKMTPITLLYFIAQKKQSTAFLEWQTAEELNSKEYHIERSNDAVHYSVIGVIPSKNFITGSKYNFTDMQPGNSRNYYRLKSVDIDAKYSYSSIKQLNFGLLANDIAVYPNPVKNILYIENNFKAESLSVILSDLAGRELFKTVKQNDALLEIPVTGIKTGIYLLTITDGKNRVTKKSC